MPLAPLENSSRRRSKRSQTGARNKKHSLTGLGEYRKKRSFAKTPEPKGATAPKHGALHFVVQKHDASHLHYDFRLELDGVLKSWAVPKGPSLNPADKRLAMETEDHPYAYKDFEGAIPEGQYGAGDVIVWDEGVYGSLETADPEKSRRILKQGYHKGEMKFVLFGEKLKGAFVLVKIKNRAGGKDNAWLLIKEKDDYSSTKDITKEVKSVKTGAALPRDAKGRKRSAPKKRRGGDPMPRRIRPMLATLVGEPFDRKGWYFETKWDGYRAIAEIRDGNATLYSRNGNDFTKIYAPVTKALGAIKHDCLLDGEIIALKSGKPDFHALQDYERNAAPLEYAVFDLLYLDGEDLRGKPLAERKKRLRSLLPKKGPILYSEHVEDDGIKFFSLMRKRGLEGMVAKDATSPYREGTRGREWLKVKNLNVQEAVILGYTKPRNTREYLGALVLGAYENGKLVYIGHSGGGFTEQELKEMHAKLSKIAVRKSPVQEKVPVNSSITWVKPKYVCEIEFTEWTPEGHMRHPIYTGMRPDKKPKEVVRERAATHKNNRSGPELTHLDKVFWPEEGYTKGDVIEYYRRMADTILPYLKDRPENLNRHPNGWKGKNFFQKDVAGQVPPFARSVKVWSESNKKKIEYLVCDNEETLLYMANLGCIELNPWNSRVESLERPDFMIFDIDPHGHPFTDVITVAQAIHRVLDRSCERSYPKTSGKTGLHIYVPLAGRYPYDDVKTFAEIVMRLVNRELPELTTVVRTPGKRGGRIYLDFLQNRFGQTIAAPYSLRPAKGATVSTPLAWSEVKKGLDPSKFTIKTIQRRLSLKGDLFRPVLGESVDLAEAIRCLSEEFASADRGASKASAHRKPRARERRY